MILLNNNKNNLNNNKLKIILNNNKRQLNNDSFKAFPYEESTPGQVMVPSGVRLSAGRVM